MRILLKLLLMPVLLAIACLIAGVYGMLHNQISYTVSPEYFTQFKFIQFHTPPAVPPRVGAAMVGWRASWWMGIVIGVIVVPLGLILRTPRSYFTGTMQALLAVVLSAMTIGLFGLGWASATVDTVDPAPIRELPGVQDPAAFRRAGTMHNSSYLGGLLGIASGVFVIARRRIRQADEEPVKSTRTPREETEP